MNGLFSCSNKLWLVISQIFSLFLIHPQHKNNLKNKRKRPERNDDLKTCLAVGICAGAAALASCQSPVLRVFPRPSVFLQDGALSFWWLLKHNRIQAPDEIGRLRFGQTELSFFFLFFIFVSKQKCEERETSFFPGKWKSVHLNTQLAQLGFDPAHFLCDPRRQPVRLRKAQRGTSSPANFECCSCTLFKDWVFYRSKKLTWW